MSANGTPVWYLEADNEGHGFARKANADFYFYAMVALIDRYLLGQRAPTGALHSSADWVSGRSREWVEFSNPAGESTCVPMRSVDR